METGSLTPLNIFLLILAANVIFILAAYGLTVLCRNETRNTVQKIGARIQEFDDQIVQLSGFLRAFQGIDQEPYFTPLEALQRESNQLIAGVQKFLETCRAFEEEINEPESNQMQSILNAPFIWFRRWRRSDELHRESKEIAVQITSAEQRMEQIYELPWELATECRQAANEVDEFAQHIQWLQSMGMRGITLQKVASQVTIMRQAVNGISLVFLNADKEELLNAADMGNTIKVFGTLSSLRPALNRYLPQVREWHTNLEKAGTEYANIKQAGSNLRQSMTNPPTGLDITPLQARLDQVAQMASEINQRLSQPDAEGLKQLARETNLLNKVLEDTGQQYQRATQQVAELQKSLIDLHEGVSQLSAQVNSLEHREKYPLILDESGDRIIELKQKMSSLGPIQQRRTPEQIFQQSTIIETLRNNYKDLAEKISQASARHTDLVALLENPEIKEGSTWLRKTREMLLRTAVYDPKNWPKKDALQTIPEVVVELSHLQERLTPTGRTQAINETGLEERLNETKELFSLHKELRPIVESIGLRLDQIQSLEKASKDRLTSAWSALEKVVLLAESNEFLDKIITENIDALGEETRQLANELNAHGQGEIEKKALRVDAGCLKVNQALNQWLEQLETAALERAATINESLAKVDAIAHLDDQPVEEARKLIQRDDINSLLQKPTSSAKAQNVVGRVTTRIINSDAKSALSDLKAIAEIKRKNDLWQTLDAVHKAIDEKISPLIVAHQEVVKARNDARDRLAEVAKNFPDKRSWPPHNQTPFTESQAIKQADDKLDTLRMKSLSADNAVLELGRLVQQYRLAYEHAGQVLNRIQQDHERIHDLEWQVDEIKQRWQTQSDPGNAILLEGIRQLISQTDSRLAYVKQQYMRGAISYEQAIQNLQLLYDEIFSAQVPIDEQNKIGLNETRHRSEKA